MPIHPRLWRDSVLDALAREAGRVGAQTVTRQGLLANELNTITRETRTKGPTPAQTVSRILQDLRDEDVVRFVGRGRYQLVHSPLLVEHADLTDAALDEGIRNRTVRFVDVPTESTMAMARRRHGQARLRSLVLAAYAGQCAVCDIRDPKLLVCSHIVPWSEDSDLRGCLDNAICLCRPHDALFEVGYWSLQDDLTVIRRHATFAATVNALLPADLVFRRPSEYAPAPTNLARHRRRAGV